MRTRWQFYIPLLSFSVILFLLSPSIVSASRRIDFATKQSLEQLASSGNLINNVKLTPTWWHGYQCDNNHYNNDTIDNPNHLQAQPLGTSTYRGLVACGPMPYTRKVDVPISFYKGAPTDYEWECPELVKRYLYLAYGAPQLGNTSGYQVVDNYQNALLRKYQNNGTPGVYPVAGDVLSFADISGDGGHTAIVTGSTITDPTNGVGTVTILDQNNTNDTSGTGTLQIGPPNNPSWVVGTQPGIGTVTGWLQPNTLVASQNPGTILNALAAVSADAANDVWAVGSYENTSGYRSPLIEHWNGSNWVNTPSPDSWTGDHYLTGVKAFSPNNVWVVGYYVDTSGNGQTIIEHSTNGGKTWNPTTQGPGFLYAIDGVSATDIWAVGTTPNEIGLTLHFTNNTWTSISNNTSPGTVLYGVSARTTTDVWTVGDGPYSKTFTMHWDGSQQWTIEPSPNLGGPENYLFGITDIATNNAWAVGRSDGNPNTIGFAIHWNGSVWSNPMAFNIGSASALTGITALSSKNIWAVGSYVDGQGNNDALIEHSSDGGNTWGQIATINPPAINSFSGITIYKKNGNVWAVGTEANTGSQTLTEFFN